MALSDPKYQTGDPAAPETVPDDAIVSPDTRRENRVPAGQSRTRKWPVLQYGRIPQIATACWSLTIGGLVERRLSFNWRQFQELPRAKVFSDFHCVTRWSRLGNLWEGVSTGEIIERAGVQPDVKYVIATGGDDGWTTNMPFEEFAAEDALLCDSHDGEPLSADHGGPVRLVVPRLYAWKSAKWLVRLDFVSRDQPGLWERMGYHNHGDPWVQDANHPDGERFQNPSSPPPGSNDEPLPSDF